MTTLDKVLFHPWVFGIGQVVGISGMTLILVWAFNYSERPFWMLVVVFGTFYAMSAYLIAREVKKR